MADKPDFSKHDCSFDYDVHNNYEHCHNCGIELNFLKPNHEDNCVFCEDCIKMLNEDK